MVKSSVVRDLSPSVVGQIQLRPFCGQPITADIVRLTIFTVDSDVLDSDCSSADVWCAVVNDLHDDLILTADTVYRLSRCNVNVSRVCTCSDDGNSDSVDNHNNAVNACDTDVVVTSEGDNECDVVHSDLNDNTLDVDEAVNNDVDDDNGDSDVISEHKDDSSGLASCSEVAREQRDVVAGN